MGSDNLFSRRKNERMKRRENILNLKSSTWLVLCEGTKTEPNYFTGATNYINSFLNPKDRLKIKVVGKGMNTTSLVKSADDLIKMVDECNNTIVPYGKIFVVFDKDDFSDDAFNKAIEMCNKNGFIPLWSNEAIEFWFLLHFNYIASKLNRETYFEKKNEYFNKNGLKYKYQKNDKEIFSKLNKYGSLDDAKKRAKKIHLSYNNESPAKSFSCTTVYKFYDEIDERLNEIKI